MKTVISNAMICTGITGAFLFLPMTLAAQDRCFTARDLARGVTITFEAGDTQTLRRIGNGHIERIEFSDNRAPTRFVGPYALYVIEEVALENGRPIASDLLKIEFDAPLDSLPKPKTGTAWQGRTTNVFSDGSLRPEVFSINVGAPTTIDLSGCTYDVLPTEVRYDWPDDGGGLTLTYDYLPALEAGYLLISQTDGEAPASSPAISLTRLSK
ncbi:hypothetical protein SAMN04488515_1391 [Cognatiyoonia koreensis]|uniref:Uncharacterized protein n=1 Tax=Cognatiyoonia koreensis TaxID=364200 RepID=A0A1I0PS52_9RHOB|nr:hypothetical protein [Cognatiyoonia koreensis]SEW17210.1 hypothetical protein SAMN04488515_1391 [Cognatiyoonia koreensis]